MVTISTFEAAISNSSRSKCNPLVVYVVDKKFNKMCQTLIYKVTNRTWLWSSIL
jgi:hypothetical protein